MRSRVALFDAGRLTVELLTCCALRWKTKFTSSWLLKRILEQKIIIRRVSKVHHVTHIHTHTHTLFLLS